MDIDVTDVLQSIHIAGTRFSVLRRVEAISDLGIASYTWKTFTDVIGSVQPTSDQSLVREEGYGVSAKTLKVITPFRLHCIAKDESGTNSQPDIVVWKGDYYLVKSVDDYTQYGAGFVEAECSSIDASEIEPGALITVKGSGQLPHP